MVGQNLSISPKITGVQSGREVEQSGVPGISASLLDCTHNPACQPLALPAAALLTRGEGEGERGGRADGHHAQGSLYCCAYCKGQATEVRKELLSKIAKCVCSQGRDFSHSCRFTLSHLLSLSGQLCCSLCNDEMWKSCCTLKLHKRINIVLPTAAAVVLELLVQLLPFQCLV